MTYFCKRSSKCLFCKKRCKGIPAEAPTHKDDQEKDGNDKLVSGDQEGKSTTKDFDKSCCSCYKIPVPFLEASFDDWEDKEALRENLKYAFLLRKLLDYPKRKCMKYLKQQLNQVLSLTENEGKEDSQSETDGWFSVCEVCTELVEEGHRIYHEIETLTAKLDGLKDKLRYLLTEEGGDDEEQEEDVEGKEEEMGTIYAEVRDYFMPERSTPQKAKEDLSVVKLEVEASLTFAEDEEEDDLMNDDFLTNETFDDGSDWAPSDYEGMDAEGESVDVKPNVEELESSEKESERKETAWNDDSGSMVEESAKHATKHGPKSRKLLRSTRSSKRFKNSKEDLTKDDDEDLQVSEVEMDTTDMDISIEQDSKPKKRKTPKKFILSDTESESMTDSHHSDDSDSDYSDKDGKDKFTCDICNATYYTRHRLRDHKRLHDSDDAYKCSECPFVAVSSRGLNMHTTKIHIKKQRMTEVEKHLKKSSTQQSPVISKKKKKKKPLKIGHHGCRFCPVTFQTAHRLREHEELHLNMTDDMIKCQHCNYICLFERGMKIHVTKYHSESVEDDGEGESESGSNDSVKEEEEERSYECKICGVSYKTTHRLREHLGLHKSKDAFRCSECAYVFRTQRGFSSHMHSQHGIKPPKKVYKRKRVRKPKVYTTEPQYCQMCPAKYYTTNRFQQHLKLHSCDSNFPCEECGWVFSTCDKRSYHMRLSHKRTDIVVSRAPPKTYQCSHCDSEPFRLRYKFREHLLLNHKDKVFHCTTCDQIYESHLLYDLHIAKCQKLEESDDAEDYEDQTKKFSCTQCNSKYRTQDLLNRHFALRHSTEQFPCTVCTSVFPTESRLRYHMARNHDKIQNICKVCGYKAHGASHLRLHMQKHTKERLFSCELCGKTFVSPSYLTGHKQMEHYQELGLEPIKCEECDLHFPSTSILKYHNQKVHEKKFKFFCEVCGKGFLFISGLKHHSAIHSTERNEICQICGAAYVHNRVLMEHLKKHHPEEYAAQKGLDRKAIKVSPNINLEGPFICKFCNVEFPSRWALHTHLKSHTEVYDKYKCGICGKGYSSPAGVKRHEDTAHGAANYNCSNCGKTFPCKDYLRYHVKNHCPKKDADASVKTEPVPSTSKRQRRQATTAIKSATDPHIYKEAGQLHIVTPNTAAAAAASSSTYFHHTLLQNQPSAFSQTHNIQPGSGASSSSSYVSAPQQPHQNEQHMSDDAAVNSLYRSVYFTQHGFHNK